MRPADVFVSYASLDIDRVVPIARELEAHGVTVWRDGERTLAMSLWNAPDQQTHELMGDFYRRVLAGEPRADALRHAQLAICQRFPNPFSWAAFIWQGEPGPLGTTP